MASGCRGQDQRTSSALPPTTLCSGGVSDRLRRPLPQSCDVPAQTNLDNILVVVRGAGDLATGVAYRLFRSGFPVVATELAQPLVVRRTVSFAEAVFTGRVEVEGVMATRANGIAQVWPIILAGQVPILVDPEAHAIRELSPTVVVDAILAKRNLGTRMDMAPIVIALGPGFTAGEDAHAVIETNRGHNLGRVILSGEAEPDTGIPGEIGGRGAERVLRAPADGTLEACTPHWQPGQGWTDSGPRERAVGGGPLQWHPARHAQGRSGGLQGSEDRGHRPALRQRPLLHHFRQGPGRRRRRPSGYTLPLPAEIRYLKALELAQIGLPLPCHVFHVIPGKAVSVGSPGDELVRHVVLPR